RLDRVLLPDCDDLARSGAGRDDPKMADPRHLSDRQIRSRHVPPIHFLALAVVFVRYVPRTWPMLHSKLLRPLVLVGQNSLPMFCLGVFLSFAAHWFLVQRVVDIPA